MGTSTSATTTGGPACDPRVAVIDPGCAPHYCVAVGQCGPCGALQNGATCASLDPDRPVCDPDSGECAECTEDDTSACPANAPICDEGACAPCTEHSQCPVGACDIEEGVCFPDDEQSVFHVKGDDRGCDGKDGKTPATALCTLAAVPLSAPRTTIRLLVSAKPPGQLVLSDEVVAIVPHSQQTPIITGSGHIGPLLSVAGASGRLYLSHVDLEHAPTAPSFLRCAAFGALYLDNVRIQGDGAEGARAILASDCVVRIERARIVFNGAGIQVDKGDLRVTGSFIMDNGNDAGSFGAFSFINAVKATITYSTIARNTPVKGISTFLCLGNHQQIEVRNSAVLGAATLSDCDSKITFNHGVVLEAADLSAVDAKINEWFGAPMQGAYPPKDYFMVVDPLEDAAQWEPGDPRYDYAGAPIPADAPSFAGALQPE